ncbi:hypothetical protein P7K49_007319 [Saguinus oedipus]|uniref:Uncharacterized protein n=1 Tax=Saguinus oedipus TaxID=9490 RepID=A0ABQ9VUI0_SAGOE|nr:hypothetical protein P7K49_007319 [Saguinus oedipus]
MIQLRGSPKNAIQFIQASGNDGKSEHHRDITFTNDDNDVVREMLFFLLLFPGQPLGNEGISHVDSAVKQRLKRLFIESWW